MEVRHFSLPYTGLAWLYMEVRHQNILQQGGSESVKIMSSNVNIFCLEHFYTIRYDTFLHTFLCSTSGISDDCKKSESEFLDDSARETTICTCADDAKESAHA